MAISDTIQSMQTNLGNAYDTIEERGGTLPPNKNLANLSTAINSIPAGGGGELNIAYGLTPPQDTSKLWVKRATTPVDVEVVYDDDFGDIIQALSAEALPNAMTTACCVEGDKLFYTDATTLYIVNKNTFSLIDSFVLPGDQGRTNTIFSIVCVNNVLYYLRDYYVDVTTGMRAGLYSFDTSTGQGGLIQTLSIQRGGSLAYCNNKIYIIGGYDQSGTNYSSSYNVRRYNILTSAFEDPISIPDYSTYTNRIAANVPVAVVGDKIYIFGSHSPSGVSYTKIYEIDTQQGVISETGATATSYNQGVAVKGDDIYLLGSTVLYKFNIVDKTFTTVSITLTTSGAGSGKHYYFINNKMYYFYNTSIATLDFPSLTNNHMKLLIDNTANQVTIFSSNNQRVIVGISDVFIGNSSDYPESVSFAIYDGTNWVNDDGTIEFTKLYPPTISISGATLTIVNDSRNSSYVTAYKIYNGQTLLTATANTTVDLSSIISTAGTYNLTVVASGTGYTDSNASNAVEFSAYSITNALTNVSAAAGNATVMLSTQSSVALTYTANSGYALPQGLTSAELNVVGADFTWNQSTGVLTLSNPTGNITVTIVGQVAASGVQITISVSGNGQGYWYDGQDNTGTLLSGSWDYSGGDYDVSITSGYVWAEGDNPGGYVAVGYFASEPTVDGNIVLQSWDSTYDGGAGGALFKINGAGTIYASFECLIEGTQITLADGSTKAIEDITYDDELLVWDFYEGKLSTAKPKWIKVEGKCNWYSLVKFSNGSWLGSAGPKGHRIFDANNNCFTYTSETPTGTLTYDQHGYFPEVVSQEIIKGEVKYYNIITDKHFNLFANGILTSCRLSNKYKIENMKYVGEELISAKEEENYFKKIERKKK